MDDKGKSVAQKFGALNRVPELKIIKEFDLPDGTHIAIRQVKTRVMVQLSGSKKMSDVERGMRIMAAKLLVNGEPLLYEDMLDCFNDEEINFISKRMANEDDDDDDEGAEKND
jgi:hypothetical protein